MSTIKISTSELYLNFILPPGAEVYRDYNQSSVHFLEQDSQEMVLVYRRLSKHPSTPSGYQLIWVEQDSRCGLFAYLKPLSLSSLSFSMAWSVNLMGRPFASILRC